MYVRTYVHVLENRRFVGDEGITGTSKGNEMIGEKRRCEYVRTYRKGYIRRGIAKEKRVGENREEHLRGKERRGFDRSGRGGWPIG